ncbi:hypothetical protein Tco_1068762 [Tanacetum coccineum]|uniref:Uncharacterized protein n=1 Tax=Tanacetum coccineum TaxID=301880 RepID=A0ABQ5HII5_9ASTR
MYTSLSSLYDSTASQKDGGRDDTGVITVIVWSEYIETVMEGKCGWVWLGAHKWEGVFAETMRHSREGSEVMRVMSEFESGGDMAADEGGIWGVLVGESVGSVIYITAEVQQEASCVVVDEMSRMGGGEGGGMVSEGVVERGESGGGGCTFDWLSRRGDSGWTARIIGECGRRVWMAESLSATLDSILFTRFLGDYVNSIGVLVGFVAGVVFTDMGVRWVDTDGGWRVTFGRGSEGGLGWTTWLRTVGIRDKVQREHISGYGDVIDQETRMVLWRYYSDKVGCVWGGVRVGWAGGVVGFGWVSWEWRVGIGRGWEDSRSGRGVVTFVVARTETRVIMDLWGLASKGVGTDSGASKGGEIDRVWVLSGGGVVVVIQSGLELYWSGGEEDEGWLGVGGGGLGDWEWEGVGMCGFGVDGLVVYGCGDRLVKLGVWVKGGGVVVGGKGVGVGGCKGGSVVGRNSGDSAILGNYLCFNFLNRLSINFLQGHLLFDSTRPHGNRNSDLAVTPLAILNPFTPSCESN